MQKKYKKYSLADKRKYWLNVFDKETRLRTNHKKFNKDRRDYAYGFILGSKSGMSKKFNEYKSNSQKFGMIAGVKSKLKEE